MRVTRKCGDTFMKTRRLQVRLASFRRGYLRAVPCGALPVGHEIVNVRSKTSPRLDGASLPGALLTDLDSVGRALHGLLLDQKLEIYFNCPNEATSAGALMANIALAAESSPLDVQRVLDALC